MADVSPEDMLEAIQKSSKDILDEYGMTKKKVLREWAAGAFQKRRDKYKLACLQRCSAIHGIEEAPVQLEHKGEVKFTWQKPQKS